MKRLSLLGVLCAAAVTLGYGSAPDASAILGAVAARDLPKVKRLLKAGADVHARDDQGRSLLFLAVAVDDARMAEFLLSRNVDVDARAINGSTALHAAALRGNDRLAARLLQLGASPRAYTKKCLNPLEHAAGYGRRKVFDLLKGPTANTPLPKDGTVVECALKAGVLDFAATQLAFHRRNLDIRTVEDYGAASETLSYLASDPAVGARLLADVVALVDRPSIPGTEDKWLYDSMLRDAAVRTLNQVARTKEQQARVSQSLLAVLERGPCSVYAKTTCERSSCSEKEAFALGKLADRLLQKKPEWPRSPEAEQCYNCATCAQTRVSNSYEVALLWFSLHKAERPRAEAVLNRQVKAKLLGKAEFQEKYRKLTTRWLGH